VEGSKRLADAVRHAAAADCFPLVLGGDHSISIGTMAGIAIPGKKHGLIWIDAHGDFNTPETTPSGNIHGMALAVNLGRGDPRLTGISRPGPKAMESATVIVGVRDLDPGERDLLRKSQVTVFTMREVDELGMKTVMEKAISIASTGVDGVHLSLDMDALNPDEAPGVGTPVEGGMTYREAHLALEMLAESGVVTSMEVVEINPALDERNRTSELAVGLIASALGQTIL
jgi:arginase